jgi:hypothetical protein
MKKYILLIFILCSNITYSQDVTDIIVPTGIAALSFVLADSDKKELAKEISQFRSKE